MIPAIDPIKRAPYGEISMLHTDPTATPLITNINKVNIIIKMVKFNGKHFFTKKEQIHIGISIEYLTSVFS